MTRRESLLILFTLGIAPNLASAGLPFQTSRRAPRPRKTLSVYRIPENTRTISLVPSQNFRVSANDCALAALGGTYLLQLRFPGIVRAGAKINEKVSSGQYHRLFTACFLHGGPGHLFVNSMSLQNLGPEVEKWMGKSRYVGIALATGIASSTASWKLSPSPSIGASGAVFGLLGAWGVFLAENKNILGRRQSEAGLGGVAKTLGLNVLLTASMRNIDHSGHLGGLVAGVTAGFLFGPRLEAQYHPYYGRVLVDKARVQSAFREARFTARLARSRILTPSGSRVEPRAGALCSASGQPKRVT